VGYGNYGDDVIFDVIKSTFKDVSLKLSDAKPIWATLSKKSSSGMNLPAHLLGGGTLIFRSQYIDPIERLIENKSKIFCFGTGVADTGYWKKTIDAQKVDTLVARWVSALNSFDYIGVRGPLSKKMLEDFNIKNVEIIGDSALAINILNVKKQSTSSTIGISIGSHDPIGRNQSEINDVIATFVKEKSLSGFDFCFLQFSEMDKIHAQEIVRKSGISSAELVNFSGDISAFSQSIQHCSFIIGQRLHATVMAAAFNIPFISLGYQPKCQDFAQSIDCSEYLIDVNDIDIEVLSQKFDLAWAERKQYTSLLKEKVSHYSQLQNLRAKEISKCLRDRSGK
jgi:hypothetical protein